MEINGAKQSLMVQNKNQFFLGPKKWANHILLGLQLGPNLTRKESCFPREIKSRPRDTHICKKTNKIKSRSDRDSNGQTLSLRQLATRTQTSTETIEPITLVFQKLLDATLFLYFLYMAVVIPLFDAQSCIPRSYYPDVLADLCASYARDYGDFLVAEPPRFFVGLVWFELAFHWPLCLANLAGILGSKPWFPTTCLVYGVSVATSMAAILSELMGSPKTSDRLKMVYFPFLAVAVLSVLRGLLPNRGKSSAASSAGTSLARKKRA